MGVNADQIKLDVLDELMGNTSPGIETIDFETSTVPSESCAPSPNLYPDLNSLALGN